MYNRKLERLKNLLDRKAVLETVIGDLNTRDKLLKNASSFGQDKETPGPRPTNDPNLSKAILNPNSPPSKPSKFKPYQPSLGNPISKTKSKKGTGTVSFVGEGDLYYEDEVMEEGVTSSLAKALSKMRKSKVVGQLKDEVTRLKLKTNPNFAKAKKLAKSNPMNPEIGKNIGKIK